MKPLTPKQREAVDLMARLGKVRRVARALGIDESSVRDRLMYAEKKASPLYRGCELVDTEGRGQN